MPLSKTQKKTVAVWGVFAVAVVAVGAAMVIYLKDASRENDLHTQTVGKITLSPVADIYSGAEDILGTTIVLTGENDEKATLTFPAVISRCQPEKAYILTNITDDKYDFEKGAEEFQTKVPELFRRYFGTSFEESGLRFQEGFEPERMIFELYEDKSGNTANYGASGYSLIGNYSLFLDTARKSVPSETYLYRDDPDVTVSLLDGRITLKEAADRFTELCDTTLSGFTYGFEVRPYMAMVSDYSGDSILTVRGEKLYEGIPFECSPSSFYSEKDDVQTSYGFSYLDAAMSSADSFFNISNMCNPIITDIEPLDGLISLSGAVELLKKNLAKYSDYTFTDIKLMYSCKHSQYELNVDDEPEKLQQAIEKSNALTDIFRPTWYFIISEEGGQSSGIKVDAVTGEITMDIL